MSDAYFSHAYGLRVASPVPLPRIPRLGGIATAMGSALRVRLTEVPLAEELSGRPGVAVHAFTGADGVGLEIEMGPAGDHLMRYGDDALYHLSSDGRILRCSVDGTGWEDGLVGPVLGHASTIDGNVVLAATATASTGGAVVLLGDAERVSLLIAGLMQRGHFLFSRGLVALNCRPASVTAEPGLGAPRLAGPVPLAGVILVERGFGSSSSLVSPQNFIARLLEAWVVPATGVEQAERRAAGFEELVCGVPVYSLVAGDQAARAAAIVDELTSRRRAVPTRPPTSTSRSRTWA